MSLKNYNVTTDSGYTTTVQLSDEDAELRGLLGKDVETTASTAAEAAEAQAKADAEAGAEAEAKAAADAKSTGEGDGQKQASAPQNKQAKPAATK